MVLSSDDCDDCVPSYLQSEDRTFVAVAISSLPFFVTFLIVATIVKQRIFPLLSGDGSIKLGQNGAALFQPSAGSRMSNSRLSENPIKQASAVAFSATIALALVLAELVLCEISDTLDPTARGIALRTTIFLLLILLVGIIPSLEIQSLVGAAGWHYTGQDAGRLRTAWLLHGIFFGAWLFGFWASGHVILARHREEAGIREHPGIVNSTTEHVGVIGISLMALLSAFAAVSAPYQSFIASPKPVSETTVSRKLAGLNSTRDLLETKRSRLRAIERKLSESAPEGFLQRAMGTFRSNTDATEKRTLEMEVSGLENMSLSLSTHHALLSSRLAYQRRARTPLGRALAIVDALFSAYCLYRILAMTLTFARRRLAPPNTPFVGADPINNILALLIRHYDSQLDRAAWTRQISFLLSGIMLIASLNSVRQTFHFFARFMPGILRAMQANLPLLVAQICATYVISVALLLRGIMPAQVVGERLRALGSRDLLWVDGWFEGWFLAGVAVTTVGVWVAAKIRGIEEWDDEEDVEMGKMS
ncbi:MAG: hypothetical protein LQ340_004156 [Diploschistes diacapsis]|nr:MAG: hypothetical protein LQ340_004156 [Diploschistes diacapsis]